MTFVIGQRWVSNTESELGLGVVMEFEGRRVTLSFPAAGEHRTYATDNAPVTRVQYQVGDKVSNLDEIEICIESLTEDEGLITYSGKTECGENLVLCEIELDCFVHFSAPQDRLFAGQIDSLKRYKMRSQTLKHEARLSQSTAIGLLGPRVQLLPHQLFIASEVGRRSAPRVLLADEVGLGKTIEAGMILHRQLITGQAKRALIVVPDSLVHQWLVEMLRRFNLSFTLLDESRCEAMEADGGGVEEDVFGEDTVGDDADLDLRDAAERNPFESTQLVLCSLNFIKSETRLIQAAAAGWDLLLVDEAHHLTWTEEEPSVEYEAIETLAQHCAGVLLLTATPEQLGVEGHFARLRLLDPDRYFDLTAFVEEERQYLPVNDLVQSMMVSIDGADSSFSAQQLLKLAGYFSVDQVDGWASISSNDALVTAVADVTHQLLDRHGTGRVLFRNTRSNVKGFPARLLIEHPLPSTDVVDEQDLNVPLQELLLPERQFGGDWVQQDTRVSWLCDFLKKDRRRKVLLICSEADTAEDLEHYLNLRTGTRSAVFHERMSLLERDRAAAYFADVEEGAQILVCSEIGSEGRNFQFAQHLVMFDLPLNPDLLEQRIGRLDRIGQTSDVFIHVPYYEGSASAKLLQWLNEGINAFAQASAAGMAIKAEFSELLEACLRGAGNDFDRLLLDTRVRFDILQSQLQQGRDQLLELNSCNLDAAKTVIDSVTNAADELALRDYMELAFDVFGVEQDVHSDTSVVLHPSDHMPFHDFPGLPDTGLTATFERDTALARDDIHYLTWEHPMVRGVMDSVVSTELGNTAVATVKLGPLKPGTLLLEANFRLSCPAPQQLQLFRYLPSLTLRNLLDSSDRDLSKALPADKLDQLLQKVPRQTAQGLIRHARPQLQIMLTKVEAIEQQRLPAIIQEAIAAMSKQQNQELQRLRELAKINPNIRQQEIDWLVEETTMLAEYINKAQLRLDSVRVIVAT